MPGQVTSALAAGRTSCCADGAQLVRGAQDVLDVFYGPDVVKVGMQNPPRLSPRADRASSHAVERGDPAGGDPGGPHGARARCWPA